MIPQSHIFEQALRPQIRPSEATGILAFLAVGASMAGVYVVLTQLMVPVFASVPGWIVSAGCYAALILPAYLLHRRFAFRSNAAHVHALPRYVAVQVTAVCLATVFSFIAYGVFGLPSVLAAVMVAVMTAGVNFVVLKSWAFARR